MIECINSSATFFETNSDGFFTLLGVLIGGIISFFISIYIRNVEKKEIKKNLAHGYYVEICKIEELIDSFLMDKPGSLPKTLPIYPESGLYLVTKEETLKFSNELYMELTSFYNHILKAECFQRESYAALKEGMREYEIHKSAFLEDLKKSKSDTTGKELSKEEIEIELDRYKTASQKRGNLAYSDSLRIDIKEEFSSAKKYIPALKKMLKNVMN